MTEDDIRITVRATLTELGIDHTDPLETQRDFAWLRKSRRGSEEAARWVRRTAVTAFVGACLYWAWRAIQAAVTRGPIP